MEGGGWRVEGGGWRGQGLEGHLAGEGEAEVLLLGLKIPLVCKPPKLLLGFAVSGG